MAQIVSIGAVISKISLKLCHMTFTIAKRTALSKDHRTVLLYLYVSARVSCTIGLFTCGRRSQTRSSIVHQHLLRCRRLLNTVVVVIIIGILLIFQLVYVLVVLNVTARRLAAVPPSLPCSHGMVRL